MGTRDLGLPPFPELRDPRGELIVLGLILDPLPILLRLRGDIFGLLGLVGEGSFFATELAWRRAVALVPLISLGEVMGELDVLGLMLGAMEGFGATAGGIVALFSGGEYKALRRPRIALTVGSSGLSCISPGLHILGLAG